MQITTATQMANGTGRPVHKTPALADVRTTRDYAAFKTLDGNRKMKTAHVRALKRSMQDRYLISPIIVNEKMQIIDGQHRLAAISELGLPVYYIVCKGYGLPELQTLNQNAKNWNGVDFVNCYADLGYEDYVIFREFQKKYKFGHNETMSLLVGTLGGSNRSTLINSGNFKVTSLPNAERIATQILECGQHYSGFRRRSFVNALILLDQKPQFIFSEFLEKLKLQRNRMVDCAMTAQYIELIEEIYNYRRQNKVNLRF